MRFLKSGILSFILCYIIMISYFCISNYKIGGDVYGSLNIINIAFSWIFFIICCIASFIYGRTKSLSGIIGLICAFILPFICFMLLLHLPNLILPPFGILIYYILFIFNTSFPLNYPINMYFPIIIIFLIILSWIIGKISKAKELL